MVVNNLNSSASLQRLADYILRAANQSDIIDDTKQVSDSTWSSNKVKTMIDALGTSLDNKYVEIDQGVSQSGRYLRINSSGEVASVPMEVESTNIDFANDF